jgi:hypothetical protein
MSIGMKAPWTMKGTVKRPKPCPKAILNTGIKLSAERLKFLKDTSIL